MNSSAFSTHSGLALGWPLWSLVETVRALLTEYAVEMGLSEQQLRRSTGFIIGILRRG
ncbi:MAG TPA: hypothetical protein VK140_09355 [Ktedonobacteraceae bacterium]|nr:hypothetical protein [Ktedonobacteraceae bacterium]